MVYGISDKHMKKYFKPQQKFPLLQTVDQLLELYPQLLDPLLWYDDLVSHPHDDEDEYSRNKRQRSSKTSLLQSYMKSRKNSNQLFGYDGHRSASPRSTTHTYSEDCIDASSSSTLREESISKKRRSLRSIPVGSIDVKHPAKQILPKKIELMTNLARPRAMPVIEGLISIHDSPDLLCSIQPEYLVSVEDVARLAKLDEVPSDARELCREFRVELSEFDPEDLDCSI